MTIGLKELGADLYLKNAFRVLGLPSNASFKTIRRRARDLISLIEIGDEEAIRAETVGGISAIPDEPHIREIAGRLEDPARRILEELFWFRFEDMEESEFRFLLSEQSAPIVEAVNRWQEDEDLGSEMEMHKASHNLAVFYHLVALEFESHLERESKSKKADNTALARLREAAKSAWNLALVRWLHLSNAEPMWSWLGERMDAVGKKRISQDDVADVREEFTSAILSITGKLMLKAVEQCRWDDAKRLRHILSDAGFPTSLVGAMLSRVSEPNKNRIQARIEIFEGKVEADHRGAGKLAATLVHEIGSELSVLDTLLGQEDKALSDLHDTFAEAVNRAQVAYTDETDDDALGVRLLESTIPHARSDRLKKLMRRNLDTIGCFFCDKQPRRPKSRGRALEVNLFKITEVNTGTGQTSYQARTIGVPCCDRCNRNLNRARQHFGVQESVADGWNVGAEPSDSAVQDFIARNRPRQASELPSSSGNPSRQSAGGSREKVPCTKCGWNFPREAFERSGGHCWYCVRGLVNPNRTR